MEFKEQQSLKTVHIPTVICIWREILLIAKWRLASNALWNATVRILIYERDFQYYNSLLQQKLSYLKVTRTGTTQRKSVVVFH